MDIKLSRKLDNEIKARDKSIGFVKQVREINLKKLFVDWIQNDDIEAFTVWNYMVPIFLVIVLFAFMIRGLVELQIYEGNDLYARSVDNHLEINEIPAYRGIILDRNGRKLAINIPSQDIYIDLREYRDEDREVDYSKLGSTLEKIEQVTEREDEIKDRIIDFLRSMDRSERILTNRILLVSGISNNDALEVKSRLDEYKGIVVIDSSRRSYPAGEEFSHILGYTGEVFFEDLEKLKYVGLNDIVGKSGVEKVYDEELFGIDGKVAREVDVLGNIISKEELELQKAVSGRSLFLTIDGNAQKKMYEIISKGVKDYGATGGAGIIEDIKTGELLVLSTYPGYDNNLVAKGISQKYYSKLLNDESAPLTNKAVSAQVPPGSTFKTIVASAALDAKVINRNTTFVSRSNYTFSNGASFQEYQNKAYGTLNLIDAISVSSNIYFCETIRRWDMDALVPYLKSFGIGEYTYIDIPGEGKGMLPSPENKKKLAESTSPWLDSVWYPEGDSCNSVIGQGITTVTPIQMANWVSAIANGGILNNPHVAKSLVDSKGSKESLEFDSLGSVLSKKDSLQIVKEGMWASVNGPRRVIYPLTDAAVEVAGKTGTAEFGRLSADGVYEHTHAWVTGFFPYKNPKYSFVVFLEDGGESYNAAVLARAFIDWFSKEYNL